MTAWEEDFTSDSAAYTDDGIEVGKVTRRAGSWECWYKGELVGTGRAKLSAQILVVKLHRERVTPPAEAKPTPSPEGTK